MRVKELAVTSDAEGGSSVDLSPGEVKISDSPQPGFPDLRIELGSFCKTVAIPRPVWEIE